MRAKPNAACASLTPNARDACGGDTLPIILTNMKHVAKSRNNIIFILVPLIFAHTIMGYSMVTHVTFRTKTYVLFEIILCLVSELIVFLCKEIRTIKLIKAL